MYYFILPIEHITKRDIKECIGELGYDIFCEDTLKMMMEAQREIVDITDPNNPATYVILKFKYKFPNAGEGYIPYTLAEMKEELQDVRWQHNQE